MYSSKQSKGTEPVAHKRISGTAGQWANKEFLLTSFCCFIYAYLIFHFSLLRFSASLFREIGLCQDPTLSSRLAQSSGLIF